MKKKAKSKKTCLFKKCKIKPRARGLCPNHYAIARNLVARKGWTWEELEKEGRALPVGSEFTLWLKGSK